MEVTLLGSGDAVGVPAPLCDCEFCTESSKRRRPGLLVETDRSTVVLDANPDLKGQLHATNTASVDAFFVTHHHFDHIGGLHDLAHAAMGFDAHVGINGGYLDADTFEGEKPSDPEFAVYLSATARDHLEGSTPHLSESLDLREISHGDAVEVGDLSIVPFPVEHARPAFDTLGFAVYHEESKIVYAPDMWEFKENREYVDADLLFAEGAALFRAFGHGEESDLRAALSDANAERTVLLNVNEHLQRMTTAKMEAAAANDGCELGRDFEMYTP